MFSLRKERRGPHEGLCFNCFRSLAALCSQYTSSVASSYSYSWMADLRLLDGLLPVNSGNFTFINICLYTVPPSVFWLSFKSTSLRIIFKYLTYFSVTMHSVDMTNPIQRTYSDK